MRNPVNLKHYKLKSCAICGKKQPMYYPQKVCVTSNKKTSKCQNKLAYLKLLARQRPIITKPTKPAKRTCLGPNCQGLKKFDSLDTHNRLCPLCTQTINSIHSLSTHSKHTYIANPLHPFGDKEHEY